MNPTPLPARPLDRIDAIVQAVSDYYHVPVPKLLGRRRLYRIALARQVAVYMVRRHTRLGVNEIGEAFNRDHSTVVHAIQVIEAKLKMDEEFARQIRYLNGSLLAKSVA